MAMMMQLFFEYGLLASGWARNVLIDVDDAGLITSISAGEDVPAGGVSGQIALPGMANLHSHAFQRAMVGLGEWRSAGNSAGNENDDFWSWREVMYRFLDRLRPEDLEAVAAQLYVEMLESGFTAVGEFHYLHHQPNGVSYDHITEMSERLMVAAKDAGIGLTLLPVCYSAGGFGGAAVSDAQQRFYNDADRFLTLASECRKQAVNQPRCIIGIAPHSLRAVAPEILQDIINANSDGPIHIHIAEQVGEVEDCIAWSGARPVEWLFEHVEVDERWCLVHATHMDAAEIKKLATSRAVAGLCPATEANLGDGIFEGVAYQQASSSEGSRWGIGTDSHIRVDVAEELRSLEYSQRLRDLGRNRLVGKGQANGRTLYDAALKGGAQALGQKMGGFEVGCYADIVSLNANHPLLIGKHGDDWLNAWIFSGDKTCVKDVWASGKHVVKDGQHMAREAMLKPFAAAMKHLTA